MLALPRDRQSEFDHFIFKKHQKRMPSIADQVIALYAHWVSTCDIQAHLYQIYSVDISPTLVSNLTDRLLPRIQEWQNRSLQTIYAIVFLDAIHYKVRQNGQRAKQGCLHGHGDRSRRTERRAEDVDQRE